MAFSGGIYETIKNEGEAKKLWIAGMQELKNEGIEMVFKPYKHSKHGVLFLPYKKDITRKYRIKTRVKLSQGDGVPWPG